MRFHSPLLALLPLVVAACSSGSGDHADSVHLPPPGGGSGSGSGSSSGGGGCSATPGYLLPLTSFSTNGGTIDDITSDGTTLYLGTQTGLFSMPVGGGALTALFGQLGQGTSSSGVGDFFFSGSDVLFVNDYNYVSVPKTGGSPTTLIGLPDADDTAMSDGTNVYLVTAVFVNGTRTYTLNTMPIDGSKPPTPIVTFGGPPDHLMLSGGVFYWIDAGDAFFGSGPIETLPVTGGTPTKTNLQAMDGTLAADDGYLYYSSVGTVVAGPTMRIAKTELLTGAPEQVSDLGGQWLVVQGADLYGSGITGGQFEVWKVPATGGTATVIACAPSGTTAQGLAVDANSVYLSVTESSSEKSGLIAIPR